MLLFQFEKHQASFEEEKRNHVENWEEMCKIKNKGGLGFGKILMRN